MHQPLDSDPNPIDPLPAQLEYKTIQITFPVALDFKQEDILVASFQFLTNKIKRKLEATKKANQAMAFLGQRNAKQLDSGLEFFLKEFNTLLILDKEGERMYIFKLSSKFESLNIKFGVLSINYWEQFKKTYSEFFFKNVLPQLKMKKEDVMIVYE